MDSVFKSDFLKGKVALITGGATGICYDIALRYAQFGCTVCIMSRQQKNITDAVAKLKETTKSDKIYGTVADVRKFEEIEQAVDYFQSQTGGRIDILVNGAAGNFLAPFSKLSPNAFKTVIQIDLIGTFLVSKAVYHQCFEAQKSGIIINITALLHLPGTLLQSHAGAAKAGVDALTKHLAVELGPKGIRVNGIAPGAIADTVGMDKLTPKGGNNKGDMKNIIPLQRLGEKKDISETALFLASDAATYITGHTVVVDGGKLLACANFPLFNEDVREMWMNAKL